MLPWNGINSKRLIFSEQQPQGSRSSSHVKKEAEFLSGPADPRVFKGMISIQFYLC